MKEFGASVIWYSTPLLCIGAAGIFGWLMAYFSVPDSVLRIMQPVLKTPALVITFIVVLYLFLGFFMDAIPAIIIFLPIIEPLGKAIGLHPVYLGLIVSIALTVGYITPPYGLTLLIACQLADYPIVQGFRAAIPFVLLTVGMIVLIILFPPITLFLPKLLMPGVF